MSKNSKDQMPPSGHVLLFAFLVLGQLAYWLSSSGLRYLRGEKLELLPYELAIRILLSVCTAVLLFLPLCDQLKTMSKSPWMSMFLAFQFGYLSEATFSAVYSMQ